MLPNRAHITTSSRRKTRVQTLPHGPTGLVQAPSVSTASLPPGSAWDGNHVSPRVFQRGQQRVCLVAVLEADIAATDDGRGAARPVPVALETAIQLSGLVAQAPLSRG